MMTLQKTLTVGELLNTLDAADATTPVLVDTNDLLDMALPVLDATGPAGDYADLAVSAFPAFPNEVQTVAQVRALFARYATDSTLREGSAQMLGRDSGLVLAPFGEVPPRRFTEVQATPQGIRIRTAPM